LYLPIEKDYAHLPANPREYRFLLDDRQGLASAYKLYKENQKKPPAEQEKDLKISSYAVQVIDTIGTLEKKQKTGSLTLDEAVSLGGYCILVGMPEEARVVLEAAYKRDPKNFMVLANLAMAYLAGKQLDRAEASQSELVNQVAREGRFVWPRKYPGWPQERLRWQLRAEQMLLTLLRQRQKELGLLPPGTSPGTDLKLDNLFPGTRFVGPDRTYTPGLTDAETQEALPPDAVAIVEQLVLWMPTDNDLQWLLGEVYNARGETRAAEQALSKLVNAGLSGEGLREHRGILEAAVAVKPAPPPEDPPWRPDLHSIIIGLGIGLIVGMLVVLQLRQLFRPRVPRTT
jgi:hypothetical protein